MTREYRQTGITVNYSDNPKEYFRQYRANKKARGECKDCSSKIDAPSTVFCGVHTEAARLGRAANYDSKIKSGSCRCGGELVEQFNNCRKCLDRNAKAYDNVKYEVFNAYKTLDFPSCNCCGISILRFLTIDHVNLNGSAHRRSLKPDNPKSMTGGRMYTALRKHGFPAGFQILCWNCNGGSFMNNPRGVCPHKKSILFDMDYHQKLRQSRRITIFNALGNACYCCNETTERFLTIDHIHGGGNAHVNATKEKNLASLVIKEGCPSDVYRIACFNCNSGRHFNGGICPHQEIRND